MQELIPFRIRNLDHGLVKDYALQENEKGQNGTLHPRVRVHEVPNEGYRAD